MPELATPSGMHERKTALQITTVYKTTLRLKSWMSQHTTGGEPILLNGRRLPSEVGESLAGNPKVLCIGPAEWLIAADGKSARDIQEWAQNDILGYGLALVDLTDGLARLEIAGSSARDVLSKSCGLDFHPRVFPVDRCARTRLAQVPVVIEHRTEEPRFELYVARSLSRYLQGWLIDAAVEFGDASVVPGSPILRF